MYSIVKKYRELQGMTRQELATAAGLSLSAVSRYEKGDPDVLSEEWEETLLTSLNLKRTEGGGVKFSEESFIRIPLPSSRALMIPNYEAIYEVLDMYRDEEMNIYAHYLVSKPILDEIAHRAFHMEPAYSLVAHFPGAGVTVYFRMKRGYLTNIERELLEIRETYRRSRITRGKSPWDVRFENITRRDVERLIGEISAHRMGTS